MNERYKTATFWNEIICTVIEEQSKPQIDSLPGEWIKYYRYINNMTRNELIQLLSITPTYLSHLELNDFYPNKKISENLAEIFKLKTKYFYDDLFEKESEFPSILKEYRINNNMIFEDVRIFGICPCNWSKWEKGYSIGRDSYLKLKKFNII